MATIGSLTTNLGLESAAFHRDLGRATNAMSAAARQMERQTTLLQRGVDSAWRSVAGLVRGLGALGVGIGVSALVGATRAAIAAGDALGDLSQQTGVAASRLQELRHAATLTGSSAATLDKGVQMFARRLGEAVAGTGELRKALEQHNIAVRDAQGNVRDTGDVLLDFAEAASRVQSAAERAELANRAFGRGGAELVGILEQGRSGLAQYAAEARELGIVSDENVAALSRAQDAMDRFSQRASTTWTSAVGGTILVIEGLIAHLGELEMFGGSGGRFTAAQRMIELSAEIADAQERVNSASVGQLGAAQAHLQALQEEAAAVQEQLRAYQGLEEGQRRLPPVIGEGTGALTDQAEALAKMVEQARRENRQLNELLDAHNGYGASVELVTNSIEIDNQLRAAKIDQQAAEASGLLTLMKANQQLRAQIEGVTEAQAEQQRQAQAAEAQRAAERDRLAAEQRRMQERRAAETERLLSQPFENFLRSVQSETADAFETVFSGGVKSFGDLFETAKQLAIRFASEMAALLVFNPRLVMGAAGAFGAPGAAGGPSLASAFGFGGAVANPAAGGVRTGPGGMLVGGGATSSMGAPAAGFNFMGTLGAAGIGGGLGALLGSQFGGQTGSIGGGLGGALGAGLGFAFGGPIGGVLGGLAGSVGGSLLGSLFGGGEDKTSGGFSGRLGAANAFGDSEIGSAVRRVDDAILEMLNSRQEAIVRNLKLPSHSINVSGGLSGSDLEAITARRLGPIAKAMGFNQREILRGDADQALQNFQTALETQRAIEDLTGAVTAFERQTEDLENTFADLEAKAKRFGISTDGLAEAQQRATADMRKAQDAGIAALGNPFEALKDPLEALKAQLQFVALNPAEQFRFVQEDFRRISEEALAGDISAIQDFAGAAQLFLQHADQFGASPLAATARAEVQSINEQLLTRLETSQTQAFAGVEDVLDRFRREQADRLDRLIELTQQQIREMQRGKI